MNIRSERTTIKECMRCLDAKAYIGNSWIEVITTKRPSTNLSGFKSLKGGKFLDSKGNVRDYSRKKSREESKSSAIRTFSKLKRLINANFSWDRSELHVTVTYKYREWNARKLSEDLKTFCRRLRRHYPEVEYVAFLDVHLSGAFHGHILLKHRKGKDLHIPRNELDAFWGHGLVRVDTLAGKTETAWYFYEKRCNVQTLSCYPTSMRIYHHSKGIINPRSETMTREEIEALVAGYHLKNAYAYNIIAEVERDRELTLNTISHEEYVKDTEGEQG